MLTKTQVDLIKQKWDNLVIDNTVHHHLLSIIDRAIADIRQLTETLDQYMSPYKTTIRKPPWACNPGCDGKMDTLRWMENGTVEATCSKCGNKVWS